MKLKLILLSLLGAMTAGAATFLDTSFNPGTGANGLVETVLPLANGNILICGSFTSYNGANASYIARLNRYGQLDPTFSASPSYWVRTMAVQPDGKIVIGGFFTSVSGQSRNLVARLNSDGSLDTSFDPGTGATGTLGRAVNDNADPFIFATAVQTDGKILITGNFTNYDGATRWGITRLNSDGSVDPTFVVGAGFNTNSWGRSLLIQKNGQIMVTGWFTSYDNHSYNRMVRLNANGAADTTFNPSFGDLTAIYSAVQLANGEYLVSGDSQNTNLFLQDMARLETDGSFDNAFVGADNEKTESIRVQPDGKILIGGYFSVVDSVRQNDLARLNADGSLDATFMPTLDNFVWDIALQTDGRILIAGAFSTVDGVSRNGVARLLETATASTPPPATNTFTASAGNYAGLFYDAGSFTNADAGYFTLTVGARGGYTARMALNGVAYVWAGTFDTNDVANKTIARGKKDPIVVSMQLQSDSTVQGTVTIGAFTSSLMAYKSTFTAANPATAYAGRYTALLTGGAAGAPAGDGYLAINVTKTGQVTLGGRLADGTPISRVAPLSSTGLTPFYTCYKGGTAVALGWVTLGANVGGSIYWEKGFSATVPVTGLPYTAPAAGHAALAVTNDSITLSSGDLATTINAAFTLYPGRMAFAATNHINALVNPANGVFTGQFVSGKARGFAGVLLQGSNSGGGYFGPDGGLVNITAAP